MKIKLEAKHVEHHLGALLASTPATAARHDLFGLLAAVLEADSPVFADHLREASVPLSEALGVTSPHEIAPALAALPGRAPKAVVDALRAPPLVAALCEGLECMGFADAAMAAAAWGPQEYGDMATVPLTPDSLALRAELVDQYRARAAEIIATWRTWEVALEPGPMRVDGRSLASASRVWQVPSITGTLGPEPLASSALYPNRIGRSAAAVAFTRANAAIDSVAPDDWVFEPLALLVAVGESVSVPGWRVDAAVARAAAMHGQVPLQVRGGLPVGEESLRLEFWWSVLSAWGSSARRSAISIPTAWRLNEAQGDVVVWALTSAAVRLAVASTAPSRQIRLPYDGFDWPAHVAKELPMWSAGALSVWKLLQRGRVPQRRTAWPGVLAPSLRDAAAWPWRSDRLDGVPDAEVTA